MQNGRWRGGKSTAYGAFRHWDSCLSSASEWSQDPGLSFSLYKMGGWLKDGDDATMTVITGRYDY